MNALLREIRHNPMLWLLVFVPAVLAGEKTRPEAHTLLFLLSVLSIVRRRKRGARGALLVGLGTGSTPTIVTTYARERCSAEDYALAFSVATAALGIGQLLGPLAAGALADQFGVAAVALFAVAVYALGAVLSLLDGFTAPAARRAGG